NFIVERPPDGLFEAFDLVCNSILPEALVFVQTPKYSFYRNSIEYFFNPLFSKDIQQGPHSDIFDNMLK
ncbi:hypothetical protein D3P08_21730, partial [Paenibacillus nanensis]